MKKIMKEKNHVVPDEVLSKEFLSQFKTEADVSKFLKQLHAQVLEKMLEGEMDAHLGYEKNSVSGHNSGNSRNGSYPKKIQTEHGEAVIPIPRDRNGEFNPIVVPKHESRGLSIEKLVISLYSKGMSVSDIEEEMREIYEIELSTSAISIITNKVNQAAQEWQNRPLDPPAPQIRLIIRLLQDLHPEIHPKIKSDSLIIILYIKHYLQVLNNLTIMMPCGILLYFLLFCLFLSNKYVTLKYHFGLDWN